MTSRRPSPGLPPHVDANDPRTLKWRVDQLEQRVETLEDQPTALDMVERLPWERVFFPLALIIALKLGWIGADVVSLLLGR